MKRILMVLFFILSMFGCAAKPYVSGSLQVHSMREDEPEIRLENPIGEAEAGVEYKNTSVFFRHMSSLSQCEEGKGYNSIGVEHKIYLEDIWKVIKCK